jgi:hypothetical protein
MDFLFLIRRGGMQTRHITRTWTADETGAVADIVLTPEEYTFLRGYGFAFYHAVTVPGDPAPTEGYGVSIEQDGRGDLLEGGGAGRSASTPEAVASVINSTPAPWPCDGALTVKVTDNLVPGAKGMVSLKFIA